jgi:hypothetical protein
VLCQCGAVPCGDCVGLGCAAEFLVGEDRHCNRDLWSWGPMKVLSRGLGCGGLRAAMVAGKLERAHSSAD